MAWQFPKLSRRTFMGAGSAAAGLSLLRPMNWLGDVRAEEPSQEETTFSICNFCSSLCNVQVTTRKENGVKRVVKLEGNPHSTLNRGKICARGQAGVRQVYDVDRIKSPLIRVEGSKRGEGKFRPVSWEEAWDYINKRHKAANIQPWEWTMVGGWTSCVFYMNWAVPFAMANGIPNIVASPMQHCVASGHLGTDSVTGNFNIHDEVLPDFDNANYILLVGNNASIGAVSTSRLVRFANGRKRGAKVVVLDSRVSETASKGDEWLRIRPGTDLDFLLAMMHVILNEQLYDETFIKRHTNLPFLVVKTEQGLWTLAKDEQNRPLVMQERTEQITALPSFTNSNNVDADGNRSYPALFVPDGFTWNGKPVQTVMQAQMAEIANHGPAQAAKTTGISSYVIQRIAREFAHAGRPIIDPGWHGARYANINMTRRVQAMLQTLVGGIDRKGGWIMAGEYHHKISGWLKAMAEGKKSPGPLMTHLAGIPFVSALLDAVSSDQTFPHGHPGWAFAFSQQEKAAGRPNVAIPAMADTGLLESVKGELTYKDKPYQTRALFINAANPVRHYYPDTRWKEILTHENVELVVAVDVLPSDTVPYCDVILPNPTYLERDEPTLYGNGVNHDLMLTTRFSAIDPLYDTLETPDILLRMSEIISGTTEPFFQMLEALSGMRAEPLKAHYQKMLAEKRREPFSQACRILSIEEKAKALNMTAAELEKSLRTRGVHSEERADALLEHMSMPRHMAVPTTSGRLEFFGTLFEWLIAKGGSGGPSFNVLAGPMPAQCRSDATMADPLREDEFYFTYGKAPTVSYGSTNSNNPVLAAINRFKGGIYTGIWIHPDRAEKLKLKTGDALRIVNNVSNQQAEGKAYITRLIHPDALFIQSAFGVENPALHLSYGLGTATNKLIPYSVEPVVGGFRSQEFTVRVEKI